MVSSYCQRSCVISNFCADQARLKSFSQYKETSSAVEYCPLFEALLKCKAVLQFLQFVAWKNFKWVLNYLKIISSNQYIYIYSEQWQACSMRSMNSKADFTKYEREAWGSWVIIIWHSWYSERWGHYREIWSCNALWSSETLVIMVGAQLRRVDLLQQNTREFWFSHLEEYQNPLQEAANPGNVL